MAGCIVYNKKIFEITHTTCNIRVKINRQRSCKIVGAFFVPVKFLEL